jgi:hypothetical protein
MMDYPVMVLPSSPARKSIRLATSVVEILRNRIWTMGSALNVFVSDAHQQPRSFARSHFQARAPSCYSPKFIIELSNLSAGRVISHLLSTAS